MIRRVLIATALAVLLAFSHASLLSPVTASAQPSQPPFSYQSEIIRTNPIVCARWSNKDTIMRRGYYVANNGFGYDKMYNYHQIKKIGVWIATVGVVAGCQPDADPTTAVFRTYFDRIQCTFWVINCRSVDTQWVRSVESNRLDPNMTTADKRRGNISIYCESPQTAPLCPPWMDNVRVPS